jgi:hypothetical protein
MNNMSNNNKNKKRNSEYVDTIDLNDIHSETNLIQYTNNYNKPLFEDLIMDHDNEFNCSNDDFMDSPYKIIFARGSNSPITTSDNSECDNDSDNTINNTEVNESIYKINNRELKTYKINIDIDNEYDNVDNISEKNEECFHFDTKSVIQPAVYRKLTYKEVEKSLEQYNINDSFKYSNELEILITYLKGQKNLYLQSKNLTQFKLNLLSIPAILIASGITIIAPFISQYEWNGAIVSGVNATITLLISFMSYFKLESSHQMFSHLANQYDKLETSLEITNSKLMFMDNQIDQTQLIMTKIREFEEKIFEIKESCVVFIPEELKPLFPIICHLNVFSFIKKIESYKKTLIVKYRDVKNEIRYILCKSRERITNENIAMKISSTTKQDNQQRIKFAPVDLHSLRSIAYKDNVPEGRIEIFSRLDEIQREKERLLHLNTVKSQLIEEIIQYKNAYSHIDNAFIEEIKNAENNKIGLLMLLFGAKRRSVDNLLIKKYLAVD